MLKFQMKSFLAALVLTLALSAEGFSQRPESRHMDASTGTMMDAPDARSIE